MKISNLVRVVKETVLRTVSVSFVGSNPADCKYTKQCFVSSRTKVAVAQLVERGAYIKKICNKILQGSEIKARQQYTKHCFVL
jgi:hypothetical protein